jgi:hypothetical protein
MNSKSTREDVFLVMKSCRRGIFRILLTTVLVLGVTACGGGGGGSASGSEGTEGIRVLHASIEAAPVDVLSSSSEGPIISQAFFAGSLGYQPLKKEVQTLFLTRALSPSRVVASFEVDGASLKRSSLLLFGDVSTFGLRAKLLEDRVPEVITHSVLRIVHGATGASAIRVQIANSEGSLVEDVIGFGEESAYLEIPHEDSLQVVVQRAVDGRLLASPTLAFKKGGAYTILVAGEVDYYVKTVLYRDS